METKIMMPSPAVDFNFDSTCTSPYASAPSSPGRFGNYFYSTPTSPAHVSAFFKEEETFVHDDDDTKTDFAFDFSGQLERPSLSADELFHGGKIKPLNNESQPHPFGKNSKESIREVSDNDYQRGRESKIITRQKTKTRSLSPTKQLVSSGSSAWYSKWKLKDLLLFRSASEGRATGGKDPLKKYSLLKRKDSEDVKNSSFRSTDSSTSVSSSRRRGSVSAHEVHYKMNRAVSEEMRKKTALPYKRGLLGCLGFSPSVPEISRGIGSSFLSRD